MLSYAQIEIPEKLIINKNDLYLKGEVKILKLWSTQKIALSNMMRHN
jgi:hypothetical protein